MADLRKPVHALGQRLPLFRRDHEAIAQIEPRSLAYATGHAIGIDQAVAVVVAGFGGTGFGTPDEHTEKLARRASCVNTGRFDYGTTFRFRGGLNL